MADPTSPTNNVPAAGPAAPSWLDRIPKPFREYAQRAILYLLVSALTVLAARYGLPAPPPVIVERAPDPADPKQVLRADPVPDEAVPPAPDVLNFCGLRANLIERLMARPWPNRNIKWSLDTSAYAGPLKRAQLVEAFDVAWKAWARDLDVLPTYVEDEATADVRSRFGVVYDDDGRPDGPGNILAWSELSDGTGRPRRQMYDRAEPWTISSSPGQAQIDAVRVAAHEIGHAMGLDHARTGAPELMAPTYSRSIQFPTAGDVDRMVALGYPRRTTGSDPAPTIRLEVSADPDKLAELLRRHGYKVELQKR